MSMGKWVWEGACKVDCACEPSVSGEPPQFPPAHVGTGGAIKPTPPVLNFAEIPTDPTDGTHTWVEI